MTYQEPNAILICGDAREVLKTLPAESVDLVMTSPPYNCNKMDGDNLSPGEWFGMLRDVQIECYRVAKPGAWAVWNIPWWFSHRPKIYVPDKFNIQTTELGWQFQDIVIWIKSSNPETPQASGTGWGNFPTYPRFRMASEPIMFFRKPGKSLPGERNLTMADWVKLTIGVWTICGRSDDKHPSTFPEEIPRRAICLLCPLNGTVLDPFAGSGTTLQVAKRMGIKSIGIEISEKYHKLAIRRISNTTGRMI